MKRVILFLITLSILQTGLIYAEDADNHQDDQTYKLPFVEGGAELPPGMEIIKAGSTNVLVPKGARVYKQGSFMTVESSDYYVARKLNEIDKNFASVENELSAIRKELEELKQSIKSAKD